MAVSVKAHTRSGHKVKGYTRGGGKSKKGKSSSKSFDKLLGKIEKQHGKVMDKKLAVAKMANPSTPQKPTAQQAKKNMKNLFAKYKIKVDYTSPIKGRTIERS